ncbi:hypothetical protein V8E36_005144, partial [Tilletia maclaganii]
MPIQQLLNAGRGAVDIRDVQLHSLRPFSARCPHCDAIHWVEERSDSPMRVPQFSRCCAKGKVVLPPIFDAPPSLEELYIGADSTSKAFRAATRSYNNAFAFVSIGGAHRDLSVAGQQGVYTYKLQGQVYHRVGGLNPGEGYPRSFASVYFVDTDADTEFGLRIHPRSSGLDTVTGPEIQRCLHEHNPYAQFLRSAKAVLDMEAAQGNDFAIKILPLADPRRYNRPAVGEVAMIVPDLSTSTHDGRDILLYYNDGRLRSVRESHASFLALRFPLLIP